MKRNIYEYIKFIENLNSKTTLEYIKLHQNELNEMYFNIEKSIINFDNFLKKDLQIYIIIFHFSRLMENLKYSELFL